MSSFKEIGDKFKAVCDEQAGEARRITEYHWEKAYDRMVSWRNFWRFFALWFAAVDLILTFYVFWKR